MPPSSLLLRGELGAADGSSHRAFSFPLGIEKIHEHRRSFIAIGQRVLRAVELPACRKGPGQSEDLVPPGALPARRAACREHHEPSAGEVQAPGDLVHLEETVLSPAGRELETAENPAGADLSLAWVAKCRRPISAPATYRVSSRASAPHVCSTPRISADAKSLGRGVRKIPAGSARTRVRPRSEGCRDSRTAREPALGA